MDNQSFEGFPISLRVCREGLAVKQGPLLKLAIFLLDKMVCSVCIIVFYVGFLSSFHGKGCQFPQV